MNEREELAQVIATNLDRIFGNREAEPAQQDYKLADGLLEAGYRKPRVVHEDYAMESVDAVLEQYYRTQLSAVDALNQIAAINGAYKMGQVGK